MKKIALLFLFVLVINCFPQNINEVLSKEHSIDTNKVVLPDQVESRENQVITQILQLYHYKKIPISA